MSNAGSGFNTMASNVFQCLNEGPRLVYEPLHYDYSTTTTTTEAAVVRTYGKRYKVRMANIYMNISIEIYRYKILLLQNTCLLSIGIKNFIDKMMIAIS